MLEPIFLKINKKCNEEIDNLFYDFVWNVLCTISRFN